MFKLFRRRSRYLSHQPKVFGLGLSRTGTTSLALALETLGYRIAHFPTDRSTVRELSRGRVQLSILRECDGITDITTIPFYKQLDTEYPGSKFILTVRDMESWLGSIERLLTRESPDEEYERYQHRPEVAAFKQWLRETVYGSNDFDRDAMAHAYQAHRMDVEKYFEGRKDLLVLDIVGGDPFSKLCDFLEKPRLQVAFPRENAAPPAE